MFLSHGVLCFCDSRYLRLLCASFSKPFFFLFTSRREHSKHMIHAIH